MKRLSIVLACCFSWSVFAISLDKVVVFGDSLSDNGNLYEYMKHQLPISPPYYEGRFSNGPVWIEHLVEKYYPNDSKAHLLDYAFGGAGVSEDEDEDDGDAEDALFTLSREIDGYLLAHQDKADDHSLYVVWMGANNYLSLPDDPDKSVEDVTRGIKHSIQRLADKGAKAILVVNLPDLGKTPAAEEFDAAESLTDLAEHHNESMKTMMASLQADYPAVQWVSFDVNSVLNEMLNYPARFGFTNVKDTCYEEMASQPSATSVLKFAASVNVAEKHDACDGFLFFDPVHPSAVAHEVMADRTEQVLADAGIEFH